MNKNKNFETIFLITSLLDCPLKNSVFTRKERFVQTKKTIESIKEKNIENICIMFIDCTDTDEEEKNYLYKECNIYIDCSKIEYIKNKVYNGFKSDGEKSYLLYAIEFIFQHEEMFLNCKHFFKLSGRYWLDEKFDFKNYDVEEDIIQTVDSNLWKNACVSCLFKLKFSNLDKFKNALNLYEYNFSTGMCTEHFLYNYIYTLKNSAIHLSILGCGGLIAINGIEGHC